MGQLERLISLAAAVADGSTIDWDHVSVGTSGSKQRNLLEQLRLIGRIASMHQKLGDLPDSRDNPEPPQSETTRECGVEHGAGDLGRWGKLILIEEVGHGAYGTVYRAHDPHLDRPVAVKLLRNASSTDKALASRLLLEGQALARVTHPGVVKVYEGGEHEGQVGLCMEFVRGVTLEQMLVSHGPFSAGEAGLIGYEICGALAAVHVAGLVHRDVKAQNVMREEGGRLVLMDFGAGREQAELDAAVGRIVGTPLYMAPEILTGAKATETSDVYSLGVLLYHLVTHDFPVKATSFEDLIRAHERGEIVRLEHVRCPLPMPFVQVVERATHPDPAKRLDSAWTLQTALARILRSSFRETAAPRLRPPQRRSRRAWQAPRGGHLGVPSVAVLPFSDMSPAKDQESFCDGMTEELINALTQISGLRVAARASTFQFKGRALDIRHIGDALNVGAVMDGSVQKHGDRLRITVDLIGVADGYHLWSQRFDRNLQDVFALQDEIAGSIVGTLQGTLVSGPPTTILAPRAKDFDAYAAYLEGRYHWNKRTEDALKKSVACFERSISRDPDFAPAHAGLADAYVTLGTYGCMPAKDVMPSASRAVERALALNSNLAEAYTCRACVRAVYDWAWAESERDFRHAIDVNPSYPTAHHWYAINHLVPRGRFDEATKELRRGLELDPLALAIKTSVGIKDYFAGRYDDAVGALSTTLEFDQGFGAAHFFLGATFTELARYPEALSELEVAMRLSGNNPEILAALGYLHGVSGDVTAARCVLGELTRLAGERYVSPARLAQVHVGLGENTAALDRLEEAHAEQAVDLAWLGVRPVFASLRDEPRFTALLTQIGVALPARI